MIHHRWLRDVAWLAMVTVLAGCAAEPVPIPVAAAPPPPLHPHGEGIALIPLESAALASLLVPAKTAIAVSALLGADHPPSSEDGVYGLLLLENGMADNVALCRAFFKGALNAVADPTDLGWARQGLVLHPTYWFDVRLQSALPARDSCTHLVAQYDYIRADAERSRLSLKAGKAPVLVAYAPAQGKMIQLDLTDLHDPGDRIWVISHWHDLILSDPGTWLNQWRLSARAQFRIHLTTAAPLVLQVLKVPDSLIPKANAAELPAPPPAHAATNALVDDDPDVVVFRRSR